MENLITRVEIKSEVDTEFGMFNMIKHTFTLYGEDTDENKYNLGHAYVMEFVNNEDDSVETMCDNYTQDCIDSYLALYEQAPNLSPYAFEYIENNYFYNYLYLDRLFIEKEYRRKGYGTFLMKYIREWYNHYFTENATFFFMSGDIENNSIDRQDKEKVKKIVNKANKFYNSLAFLTPVIHTENNNCNYYIMECMDSFYKFPKKFRTIKLKTLDN